MTALGLKKEKLIRGVAVRLCLLLTFALLISSQAWGAYTNVMTSLEVDSTGDVPVVKITMENPVSGYKYTTYGSIDPLRIVYDFNGMNVDSILSLTDLDIPIIESVKVSSFDLPSGSLGRVEIILSEPVDYDTEIDGTNFQVVFLNTPAETAMQPVVDQEVVAVDDLSSENIATAADSEVFEDAVVAPLVAPGISAGQITDVDVSDSAVVLQADGNVEIFKFYTLGAPARLVVDVYGLKAGFKQRQFDIGSDFSKMRVGAHDDKVRFVFDAPGEIPDYSVVTQNSNIVVSWGEAASDIDNSTAMATSGVGTVNVEAVDFSVENGTSILRITTNDAPVVIQPSQKGDIVGFGIENATISRALRRAVDASSFPSAIRLVTPYTVLVGEQQDVRFAVELKGPSEFELISEDNSVVLKVVNGPFAEPDPMTTQVAVEAPVAAIASDGMTATAVVGSEDLSAPTTDEMGLEGQLVSELEESDATQTTSAQVLRGDQAKAYSGQRISLVFDNADIRNILQLIAEVSDLNILAGDGVEGTITLRLIDVPWDQALDLILDTKDLGMIRDGNVAKILPKESIRSMDEAKFTAKRTQEKLEDLVTEVIKISYTDLSNVSTPIKDLLTERGKITEDTRNKQLIVTDIQKSIVKIKELAKILDTPERQVLIEARIVEVSTTANLDLGVNWDIFYSQDAQHDGTGNAGGEIGMGGNFVVPAFGAGTGQTAGFGTGFSWGQVGVNTTILDLRLSALETAGEGRVVSNPRIMALNGEKAKISQGTMIPYQTVSADEIKTELVEAALSLEVTPVINPDNTVIMVVKATNSTPGSTVATGAGAAPSIDTKEAETKMLVKDGETMVIGGIYVEKDDFSENGVPILMDIPLLGHLFKSTKTNKNRSELMIFITPRILD